MSSKDSKGVKLLKGIVKDWRGLPNIIAKWFKSWLASCIGYTMWGFFKEVILLYLFNCLEGGVVNISSIVTIEIGFRLVS